MLFQFFLRVTEKPIVDAGSQARQVTVTFKRVFPRPSMRCCLVINHLLCPNTYAGRPAKTTRI